MMRPRKARAPRVRRPRGRRFRGFWACLFREAAFQILDGRTYHRHEIALRKWIWRRSYAELRKVTAQMFVGWPSRRFKL